MSKYVIGVDIGGTKIAAGLVASDGKLKKRVTVPTFASKGLDVSLGQVYRSIDDLLKINGVSKKQIEGIGVCAPGPLDPAKGVVHNPPNLPGWREIPLVALIRKKYEKKTRLENDANAAGMAEVLWGAARGYKHVFYVTVSTGIGTAVIINGKIYHGKNGMAGEAGHSTISYNGKDVKCNCGNNGCIEAFASGPGTVRRLLKSSAKKPALKNKISKISSGKPGELTMADLGKAARAGDKLAVSVIADQGRLLGVWLGNMISILDPEIIVVGGGVSLIGNLLFDNIREAIPEHTINALAELTPVVQAKLKKDVGVFGAASIMM